MQTFLKPLVARMPRSGIRGLVFLMAFRSIASRRELKRLAPHPHPNLPPAREGAWIP